MSFRTLFSSYLELEKTFNGIFNVEGKKFTEFKYSGQDLQYIK